jgi:protein transport protein SEC24
VYHYPGFHGARDGVRLAAELRRNLTRATAWEAVMRIRCSRGLKIGSFHGHFFNRR